MLIIRTKIPSPGTAAADITVLLAGSELVPLPMNI